MGAEELDTAKVYSIIADTMPTEGRDFTMAFEQGGDGKSRLVVKPLTAVGRGFVPLLLDQLKTKMGDQGVTFASDGIAEQEAKTINTIRAAIERDAMAALKANLDSVISQQKARREAMALEDRERGQRAMSEDELKRRNDDSKGVMRLASQQRQMQYMLDHMGEARDRANKAARAAAEKDSKKGVDWSVDLDAPLKSLFDERDVAEKLNVFENTVHQLSAHMFMVEDLTRRAAAVGKQYILKK